MFNNIMPLLFIKTLAHCVSTAHPKTRCSVAAQLLAPYFCTFSRTALYFPVEMLCANITRHHINDDSIWKLLFNGKIKS